jgi:hypothetical protein
MSREGDAIVLIASWAMKAPIPRVLVWMMALVHELALTGGDDNIPYRPVL